MGKKIENPIMQAVAFFLVTALAAIILWPLFDFLWGLLITHSEFEYSVSEYILSPLLFAFVFTIVFNWKALFGKKSKK